MHADLAGVVEGDVDGNAALQAVAQRVEVAVPNLWYGCASDAIDLYSWLRRQPSDCRFFSFSEWTALSSRPAADSVNDGQRKNCAKRSSAACRCGCCTSK